MSLSGWCSQLGIPDCKGCARHGVPCDHDCHTTSPRPVQVETVHLTTDALDERPTR